MFPIYYFNKQSQIVFHRADARDPEFLHKHLAHIRRAESGQRGAQMDVFDAQGEQRQQHDYSLLLVLGKVEGNWHMPFDCSNIFANEISHHNCLGNAL